MGTVWAVPGSVACAAAGEMPMARLEVTTAVAAMNSRRVRSGLLSSRLVSSGGDSSVSGSVRRVTGASR